jgi:hypothetical protein
MRSGPWKKFLSHGHVPARLDIARPLGLRRVLAGGEEPVGQGLRNLGDGVMVYAHGGQQGSRAIDGEVRRPWRCSAVPDEGPVNVGNQRAHEHQWAREKRFPYLDWTIRRRGVMSTTRPITGGAGEGRRGVGQIRRGGWPGLDRIRSRG